MRGRGGRNGKTEEVLRAARRVLSTALVLGFAVQIALGLAWMIPNFTALQLFGDTNFYVTVSGTLRCDEYTGVLYPAVLLIVRALLARGPIPWYSAMYALQIAALTLSACFFFRTVVFRGEDGGGWRERARSLFAALAVLTFPMELQCVLAILPNCLLPTLLFPELAYLYRAAGILAEQKQRENASGGRGRYSGKRLAVELAKVCFFWLCLALTMPEYLLVGAAAPLTFLIAQAWALPRREKWRMVYSLLIAGVFCALILAGDRLTQEKGRYGRPQRSAATTLFDRTAWPAILGAQDRWSTLADLLPEDVLYRAMINPENVQRELEPALEELVGTRKAQEWYRIFGDFVLAHRRGTLFWTLRVDAIGALLPPVGTRLLLAGSGYESFAARNFDVMKRRTPILTKYVVDYGLFWFEAGLVLALLAGAVQLAERRMETPGSGEKRRGRKDRGGRSRKRGQGWTQGGLLVAAAAGTALLTGGCLLLRGCGTQDYKLAIGTTALWLARILRLGMDSPGEEREG